MSLQFQEYREKVWKARGKRRLLTDYHIHTQFSGDSTMPMEEAVLQAMAMGLEEICFTEHIDYGIQEDWNCDCDAYFRELERCRDKWGDKVKIRSGMEFGMQVHTVELFQETFDRYPFDFIILSCHEVGDRELWNYEFQLGKSQDEYNRRYYEEILNVVKRYQDFSVLGHLDMIRRYDRNGDYPFERVRDVVEEILRLVIAQGKGIEVNTSCYRYGLADLTPGREILKLYRELGGEIITIGSDAHTPKWIGWESGGIQEELLEMGFEGVYTFEGMRAVRHDLAG